MAARQPTASLFLALALLLCAGAEAIQNEAEPTARWRTWRDESVLAGAGPGRDRTSDGVDEPVQLQRTAAGLDLESSRGTRDPESTRSPHPHEQLDGLEGALSSSSAGLLEPIEGNQIEVRPGEYYAGRITPTSSEKLWAPSPSGEARGAPGGSPPTPEPRSPLPQSPLPGRHARTSSEHAPSPSGAAQQRQANPDIQDIITGIVKLLNGKVNVAVSSAKPARPVHSTRINNRGPPRISDVVPLPPDFDTPGMNPPPPPLPEQPSSFERPPAPSPPAIEQLPPWKRPGVRRPVPAYKPLPPAQPPQQPQQQPQPTNALPQPSRKYQSTLNTEQPPADNTLVLGGLPPLPLPIPSDQPDRHDNDVASSASSSTSSTTSSQILFQTTLNVATSSSVRMIETTSTTTMLEPSMAPAIHSDFSSEASSLAPSPSSTSSPTSVASLEPSRSSTIKADLTSSLPTPTEALATVAPLNSAHKSTVQPITNSITFSKGHSSVYTYRPRPGIVLDDTLDFPNPHQGLSTHRPYGPPRQPSNPDTFDVVVSAIQGPGGSGTGEVKVPVNFGAHGSGADDILTSPVQGQDFVSIDGKRTYLNLFDNSENTAVPSKGHVQPTRTQNAPVIGTGFAVPTDAAAAAAPATRPSPPLRSPTYHRRPTQPTVRIDTCIVGDSSTCDASQHEACATVQGVSACHCKPGFAKLTHSLPCKKIVSIVVSIRVDKIYNRKLIWTKDLEDRDSGFHHELASHAHKAIESAMSMTPFSDEYVGASINNIYQGDVSQGQGGVFVNATLKLAYEPRTARQSLAAELQKQLLGVIQRRYNNIGESALYVDSPAGSISNLQDLDECASSELNDCHSSATCTNTWGAFTCSCNPGLKDPHKGEPSSAGRTCLSCPSSHCNNRGTCSYKDDQMHCSCTGNYYGAQCEIDGEVLGVAIGASVAALIIIVLTLVCLVMWSRRWSREQKAISPVYGYVQGTLPGTLPARVGSMGTLASVKQGPPTNLPPYMWAQLADHLATANVYATEPMGPTRPSSAMIGYPTLSLHGTLPPVPLPRLQAPPRSRQRHQPEPDSSDSEPQDKDRADLIPQSSFQVPRPKSRSSLANQSGIYYDVEYDQGDARHLSKNNIPMSTYSMAPYYRT